MHPYGGSLLICGILVNVRRVVRMLVVQACRVLRLEFTFVLPIKVKRLLTRDPRLDCHAAASAVVLLSVPS